MEVMFTSRNDINMCFGERGRNEQGGFHLKVIALSKESPDLLNHPGA
jgi:hypothetical protein